MRETRTVTLCDLNGEQVGEAVEAVFEDDRNAEDIVFPPLAETAALSALLVDGKRVPMFMDVVTTPDMTVSIKAGACPTPRALTLDEAVRALLEAVAPFMDEDVVQTYMSAWEINSRLADGEELHDRLKAAYEAVLAIHPA